MDEREVGNLTLIRVFRKTKDGEKEEVEVLPIKPGQEYILYSHKQQNISSGKKLPKFMWFEPWLMTDGQESHRLDPHACLRKKQQCKLCPHIAQRDGWKVGENELEPHRSLAKEVECAVCSFQKKIGTIAEPEGEKEAIVTENLKSLALNTVTVVNPKGYTMGPSI